MLVSVIIPTYRRSEKLAALLRALSRQTIDDFEVIVTIDGFDAQASQEASAAWAPHDPARLHIIDGPKQGPCAARNRAIARAQGVHFVFFNDDVVPDPDCIELHLAAHRERESQGLQPAIIVGDAPWKLHEPDSLFARMLRETSMVFFHHHMRAESDLQRDWGFRHAWLLNLSAPAQAVRAVGGLRVIQNTYGRDDDELAFRLTRDLHLPVLWRPQARVVHDHFMTPDDYLTREYELGFGAPAFAKGAPECARVMFKNDPLSPEVLAQAQRSVEADLDNAASLLGWFRSLAQAHPMGDPATEYTRHLPLKRWCWNKGYVNGSAGLEFSGRTAVAALDTAAKQLGTVA
jgi:GT2 family glycosyltransferase